MHQYTSKVENDIRQAREQIWYSAGSVEKQVLAMETQDEI